MTILFRMYVFIVFNVYTKRAQCTHIVATRSWADLRQPMRTVVLNISHSLFKRIAHFSLFGFLMFFSLANNNFYVCIQPIQPHIFSFGVLGCILYSCVSFVNFDLSSSSYEHGTWNGTRWTASKLNSVRKSTQKRLIMMSTFVYTVTEQSYRATEHTHNNNKSWKA